MGWKTHESLTLEGKASTPQDWGKAWFPPTNAYKWHTHTHIYTQAFNAFTYFYVSWRITCPSLSSRWESPAWIRVAESKLERKRPTLVNISTPPFKIHASSWHGKHFRTNCMSTNKTTRTVCHCMSSIGIWLATKQPKGGFKKITLPHAKLTVFFDWACRLQHILLPMIRLQSSRSSQCASNKHLKKKHITSAWLWTVSTWPRWPCKHDARSYDKRLGAMQHARMINVNDL